MVWPPGIALTCIALTLLANAMRDVLERTVVARAPQAARGRRRRTGRPRSSVGTHIVTPRTTGTRDGERRSGEVLLERHGPVGRLRPDRRGGQEVVHGVSLDIRNGEVHGLIGESGSGKTQTAFSVLGLLPEGGSVTGGTIDYEGTRPGRRQRAVDDRIRGKRSPTSRRSR